MGKSELQNIIREVRNNIDEVNSHLEDYDVKYDLYLKFQQLQGDKIMLDPLYEQLDRLNTFFNRVFNLKNSPMLASEK